MDFCGYCKYWDGDRHDIEHIDMCVKHKIFQRGTRPACNDWKVEEN